MLPVEFGMLDDVVENETIVEVEVFLVGLELNETGSRGRPLAEVDLIAKVVEQLTQRGLDLFAEIVLQRQHVHYIYFLIPSLSLPFLSNFFNL